MAFATQSAIGNPALAGASALRRPFTAVRSTPRSLVVRAEQGPNDAAMKTIGAIAAAQIALLPLSGAAMADAFPATGAINSNPAEAFANKAKSAGNKAKAAVAPNPIETLNAKTKAAAQDAKGTLAKNGLTPDPVKDLANKAKAATKKVSSNPAADFANKGKKAAAKVQTKAGPTAKKAVNKAAAVNPAKEFAAKAKQAKNKATGGPLSGIPVVGTIGLQQDVLFGFGERKIQQVQRSAGKAVDQAADAGQAAASKAADAGQDVAEKANKATPSSFSIFDASSVQDAREKLKANIEEAAATKSDPAERVASIGKPGESQEENAERIRREAENGNVLGGDARAPTDGGAPAQ